MPATKALGDAVLLALVVAVCGAAVLAAHHTERAGAFLSVTRLEDARRAAGPLYAGPLRGGRRAGALRFDGDTMVVALAAPAGERIDWPCAFAGQERIELSHASSRPRGRPVPPTCGTARAGALTMRSCSCVPLPAADAARLVAALDAAGVTELWSGPSPFVPAGGRDVGLLGPAAGALGVAPVVVVDFAFVLVLLVSLVPWGARRDDVPAPERVAPAPARYVQPAAWAACVLLLAWGLALRASAATGMRTDGDEGWSFPSPIPIFTGNHDAWVHPPLGRALALAFGRAIGWSEGAPVAWLRAPSVALAAAALVALVVAAGRTRRWEAVVSVAAVALGSGALEAGALARPYALAGFAWGALVVATRDAGRATRVTLPTAALAALLAAYTDLLAGACALVWLGVWLARATPRRAAPTVGAAVALAAAPLVPGALRALAHHVAAGPGGADLVQHDAVTGLRDVLAALAPLSADGHSTRVVLLGAALALGTVAVAWRRGLSVDAATLGAVLAAVAVAACFVALRARNVAFVSWAVAGVCLAVARRRGVSPRSRAFSS